MSVLKYKVISSIILIISILTGVLISFNTLLTGNIFYERLGGVIIVISSVLSVINLLIFWRIEKANKKMTK